MCVVCVYACEPYWPDAKGPGIQVAFATEDCHTKHKTSVTSMVAHGGCIKQKILVYKEINHLLL
jgi:hypothetical protein